MCKVTNPNGAQVYHFLRGIPVMIYGYVLPNGQEINTGVDKKYQTQTYVEYKPQTPADTLEEVFVREEDLQ